MVFDRCAEELDVGRGAANADQKAAEEAEEDAVVDAGVEVYPVERDQNVAGVVLAISTVALSKEAAKGE